jgi:hypothetical protein
MKVWQTISLEKKTFRTVLGSLCTTSNSERKYLAATVKVREREEGEGREFKPEPPVILGSMVCQRDEQELNDSHLSALI